MPYNTLKKRVGNGLRLADVVRVLLRHGFADLLRRIGVYEGIPAKILRGIRVIEAPSPERHDVGYRLRAALTELGPTFIKLGQLLSTRPDLVGHDMAKELCRLQDQVAPEPFDIMKPAIEKALGGPISEMFSEFPEEPVAAASLSQVYRARLKTGQTVAVKVQRPKAPGTIQADLSLLRGAADWAAEHSVDLGLMDPKGMVEEFERAISRELDFMLEARVIDRFRANFENNAFVFVPRTYPDCCANTILTMDWIDGVRVDAVERFPERHSDPKIVAFRGCDVLCKQVFRDHLFHADPHPGNILVTKNNQLAFLDYGMVGHLERSDVQAMADLLRAVFDENPEGCTQAVLMFTSDGEVDDPEALEHDIAEYIAFQAKAVVAGGMVGKAIEQVIVVLRRHKLRLAPRFSLLLKALATIESTGRQLDPDMDMIPVIRPYVEQIIAERFSPMAILGDVRQEFTSLLHLARQFPGDVRHLLRMLRRGKFQIHLQHEKLNYVAAVLDRASNRLTVGVITGSIIIGSSLLISTGSAVRHIGMAGYLMAGVLGLALVISILRSKNY